MSKKGTEDGNVHEKAYWTLGIAWIVFLILVLGSIIGLKILRNGIGNVVDKDSKIGSKSSSYGNYEILEDGRKNNINDNIKLANIDVDDVKFSNFSIVEKSNDNSGEFADTEITFDIHNQSAEEKVQESYIVKFFNDEEQILVAFTIRIEKLEPGESIPFMQYISSTCVDASDVEVERIDLGEPMNSQEENTDVVSGDIN